MSSDSMNHRYVIGLLVGFLSLSLLGGLGVGAAQAQYAQAQYVDTTRITSEGTSGFKGDGEFGAAVAPFSAHPEVIIGAPRENVGSDEGVTHLVSPTTGQIVENLNTANPTNLGRFGASVGSVADTVVVGAPNEDPPSGETGAGYAYLFDGTSGARLKTLQTSSAEREPGRGLGRAVAGIGDVNGDGEPDAVVGAPGKTVGGNSGAGKAYIFSGADGSVLGAVTGAEEKTGRFGEAVAAVGDVIGDATPDFLVGAPREDVSGTGDAGRVYLFSGGDRSNVVELTAPSGNRVAGGRFGIALSTVGGESDPDFLVGAYREDGGGVDQAGRAYLLDGANPQSSPLQAFTSALPEQSGSLDGACPACRT